ncbi:hypothetical protein HP548_12225 [Paenibacillus taichungensis]|uniref:Uncharacterized protein n=1 Tax=Paenibacillus taichungensis TaxID=484184 RepID=A0ABX2MLC0_9BACL|nr:hypothetical protein [Paenibacillus taichungensis]NUU54844.1 hypothetical protein [Paenibacillus taichungensis]
MSVLAEKIVLLDENEENESEIDFIECEFFEDNEDSERKIFEYDRDTIRNIRTKAGLVMDLITSHEQVIKTLAPPRTRHEINGGYKIANRRGARLHEVEVFNLYFKFRSHLRGDGIALMYRTNDKQERIILLPDDTRDRVEQESRLFLDIATELTLMGYMEPDVQNDLIENLRLLNIHERCAQSLQHEYGHILHWREFDELGIHTPVDIFDWFVVNGYYENVERRIPHFEDKPAQQQLMILKESLVEDYRISLNLSEKSGKFISPNKFCHFGDFQMPELLEEGVRIMKEMLTNQINKPSVSRPLSSSEMDSLEVIRSVASEGFRTKWRAGVKSSTGATIHRKREELIRELQEVAATTE